LLAEVAHGTQVSVHLACGGGLRGPKLTVVASGALRKRFNEALGGAVEARVTGRALGGVG